VVVASYPCTHTHPILSSRYYYS
jgi:ketosteroid isomerase-like protein